MKIITQKNNLKNYVTYLNNLCNSDYIDGIILPTIMTKDKQIIVFDEQVITRPNTEILQNSTLQQIKNENIFLLSTFFNNFKKIDKRIIINVYPLYVGILSNETIQYVNELYTEYINEIYKVIKQYPEFNISLCTVNLHLLQLIKQNIPNNIKKGLIIVQENLNYLDVNFYIISPIMLDAIILKEEIDNGKEIMITAISSTDISIINDFFKDKSNKLKNEIFAKITFITPFPDILYNLLYNSYVNKN